MRGSLISYGMRNVSACPSPSGEMIGYFVPAAP